MLINCRYDLQRKNKINLKTVHKTSQKTLLEKNDIVELHLTMFH